MLVKYFYKEIKMIYQNNTKVLKQSYVLRNKKLCVAPQAPPSTD